jgi:hypothetical protein
MTRTALAAVLSAWLGAIAAAPAAEPCRAPPSGEFRNPEPVAIRGYDGEAMEPFLSRDGKLLFFNNRNEPAERTDLHWATAVDALTFQYRGLVDGANSTALDGVPTMDSAGRFCFVSTRSYRATRDTVHCGRFEAGKLRDARAVPGLRSPRLGQLIFDVELAADGEALVFADGTFSGGPVPDTARLGFAHRQGGDFVRAGESLLAAANAEGRNYAPALSRDGCELFFTRLTGFFPFYAATIWRSVRRSPEAPFEAPERIRAIESFTEGPTISPDGHALYYHARRDGRFRLFRVTR